MPETEIAPQGGEAGATSAAETAPVVEAEVTTEQQPVEADPFANIPFEKVRERYADDLKVELDEREKEAFRRAQGESRKEFHAWRQKQEGEWRDEATYDRLKGLLDATDDYEKQETYRQEIANPEMAASYARGQQIRLAKASGGNAAEAHALGIVDGLFAFHQALGDMPEAKLLPDGELEKIREDPKNDGPQAYLLAAVKAMVEAGVTKGKEKWASDETEALEQKALAKLRAKGIGVEDLMGGVVTSGLTPEKYKGLSDEQRARLSPEEIDAMTRKRYVSGGT
jgi:hypothetical protein